MIYDSFYAHCSIASTTYWYADQVVFLVHWLQSKLGYYSGAECVRAGMCRMFVLMCVFRPELI